MLSLTTLATQIVANLIDESASANEYKWQRACLYKEAREQFKADRAFGKWMDENVRSTAGGVPTDANTTVQKLILCAGYLEQDQFCAIGYTNAAELMVKATIEKFPEQWRQLVGMAVEGLKKSQVRSYMADIKAGRFMVEPEPVIESTVVIPSAQPREGVYFSEDPFTRELQRDLISSNAGKACEFLGVNLTELQEGGEEVLTNAYRRASMKYHPDRNGEFSSAFAFGCVEQAYALISGMLGLQTTMAEINEMMGN